MNRTKRHDRHSQLSIFRKVRLDSVVLIVSVNVVFSALAHILRITSFAFLSGDRFSDFWCQDDIISYFTGVFFLLALASVVDFVSRFIAHRQIRWPLVVTHAFSIVLALGNLWIFLELYLGPATLCTFREVS